MTPGSVIEYRETGLGARWRRGELVEHDGRRALVRDDEGREHRVTASRVREVSAAPARRAARLPAPVPSVPAAPVEQLTVSPPGAAMHVDDAAQVVLVGGSARGGKTHAMRARAAAPVVRPSLEAIVRSAPLRAPAYLAFVRELPCAVCRAPAPSEAHHFGPHGTGTKTDDTRVVPLCTSCHTGEFHRTGRVVLRGRRLSRLETERLFFLAMVDAFTWWSKREVLFDARSSR